MHAMHRKPRKQRIAMQRFFVLAAGASLDARTLCQCDVTWGKRIIHAKRRSDFLRDESIFRSRHSPIEFREEKDVGRFERRMFLQEPDDTLQMDSTLNVPRNRVH